MVVLQKQVPADKIDVHAGVYKLTMVALPDQNDMMISITIGRKTYTPTIVGVGQLVETLRDLVILCQNDG